VRFFAIVKSLPLYASLRAGIYRDYDYKTGPLTQTTRIELSVQMFSHGYPLFFYGYLNGIARLSVEAPMIILIIRTSTNFMTGVSECVSADTRGGTIDTDIRDFTDIRTDFRTDVGPILRPEYI